jgi:hypothetical protein
VAVQYDCRPNDHGRDHHSTEQDLFEHEYDVILLWAGLIVAAATAVAVAAMLLVRRRAPEGSYFEDGDRAAGMFGVLATGSAVLLGFVVFLAFESYDTSRSGAEAESRTVVQMFETAQFLPQPAATQLSGELICYARNVVHQEWPAMETGSISSTLNPWAVAMFHTLKTVKPRTPPAQTAYSKWFDQVSDRENARADRTHGAEGVIPTPLWIVLLLSAGIIFAFMLLFADSGERAFVQAAMVGSVTVVISSTLVLLWFLDHPYHSGVGGLHPVAMQRSLSQLGKATAILGRPILLPCTADGLPRR